jgi:hypothetical protein
MPMPRLTLGSAIPVILVLGTLGLFLHKAMDQGPQEAAVPASTATADAAGRAQPGFTQGSGAHPPPPAEMNPTPAGTPEPPNPGNVPPSATPQAPSGESARPVPGG